MIAIAVWMVINAIFMALEITVLNDWMDLNNSILLVLTIASTVSIMLAPKYGIALTTFTIIYAFSFNAFNLIYYGFSLLNVISAIANGIATVFLFATTIKSSNK